jgi:hypothetical protein
MAIKEVKSPKGKCSSAMLAPSSLVLIFFANDVVQEWHLKLDDKIIAQEAAELIGLAAQNYITNKPSIQNPDEVRQ